MLLHTSLFDVESVAVFLACACGAALGSARVCVCAPGVRGGRGAVRCGAYWAEHGERAGGVATLAPRRARLRVGVGALRRRTRAAR